jgi:AraC-like DNA-binding protein
MGIVVFGTFMSTLRNEIEQSVIVSLSQIRQSVDTRTKEIERIALRISNNPALTPFMVQNGGYNYYETVEQLKEYQSTNTFLSDIVLYYGTNDNDMMYAASGTYSTDSFFNYVYHFASWTKKDFLDRLTKTTYPQMRPPDLVDINGRSRGEYAVYLYPIPFHSTLSNGVVMFLVEESSFSDLFGNFLKSYQGISMILNPNGEPIMTLKSKDIEISGTDLLNSFSFDTIKDTISTVQISNKQYSLIKLTSEYNLYTYITLIPTHQFLEKANKTSSIFRNIMILMLVISLLLGILFSLRHYRPLQKLAINIRNHLKLTDTSPTGDEIHIIDQAFGEVSQANEGLKDQLKSQASILREQALYTLLKGNVKTEAKLSELKNLANLQLDKPSFAAMIFLIDHFSQFESNNSAHTQDIFRYSLKNIVEELSLQLGIGYALEMIDGHGIIVLINMEEALSSNDLVVLGNRAKHVYREHFKISLTVGIGRIYNRATELYKSFLEAGQAAGYRFIRGGNQVFLYENTITLWKDTPRYPIGLQNQLAISIKQGQSDEANRDIRSIMIYISQEQMPLQTVEYICFDIINTIIKTVIEMNIELDTEMMRTLERLYAQGFETMELLEQTILTFCVKACDRITQQRENKKPQLFLNLKLYVDNHYRDQSITLDHIAEHFGLSASYITSFFKELNGESLMRYVDNLRMEEAKRLLRETNLLMKDIIEHCGYVDPSNFIRKFKRSEGLTPTQYREINGK